MAFGSFQFCPDGTSSRLGDVLDQSARLPHRPFGEPVVTGARRSCVLDVETAPDHFSVVLSGRRGNAMADTPLHALVNVSFLAFSEEEDGTCSGFELVSYHTDFDAEERLLDNIEDELERVRQTDGSVITFNGLAHDLPVLRQRRLRWWRFSSDEAGLLLDANPGPPCGRDAGA